MMEVEMKIRGLMMDPITNMPIVVLKDVGSEVVLPIWVGVYEANAIALEIEKVTTPRPMTHDLLKNLLVGLDTHVHKVVVSELRDDTYFAVIWMERDGKIISMTSRRPNRWVSPCVSISPSSWTKSVLRNPIMSRHSIDSAL